MKNRTTNLLYTSILIGVYFFVASNLLAQTNKLISYTAEEKQSVERLKKEGISDTEIERGIMKRRLMHQKEKATPAQPLFRSGKPPVVYANSCGGMGGENGWDGWQASIGDYSANANTNPTSSTITYSQTNVAPSTFPTRFVLTGAGSDNCTPGPAAGSPRINNVAPGFGNASIRLGERTTNGMDGGCTDGCVERLTYTFNVTNADTNFIYAYAMVFNFRQTLNNLPDHNAKEVPFAEIYILDGNGKMVPCSHQKYMGDTTGQTVATPGLYSTTTGCDGQGAALYKPWTVVGVNLAKYLNQTLTVYISNADCAQGGHYCHSYWDFMCPPLASSITPYCQGQQTTMNAPVSGLVSNPYSYQWYKNNTTKPFNPNQHWTIIPGATGVNYVAIPNVGDTFSVHVIQPSKCDFWIPYIPTPTDVKAEFNNNGACGKMTFQDLSTVLPASATNSVVAWNWSFPGGSPVNANTQNPGTITYPPGTYTATLISTSVAGCKDTIKHTFTVGGFPTAAFTPTSPCLGVATTILDGSLAPTGDPIASWKWLMPGGVPAAASSNATSPTHSITTTYQTGGTHIVTLIVASVTGCIDTIEQQVLVYNPPIANFTKPDSGCSPVIAGFNDISDPVDGSIATWQWSFPGGSPATANVPSPTNIKYTAVGSYSVSLAVTTNYGCKHNITLPMINVYAWPNAEFSVTPSIAPTTDPVFKFDSLWSKDVKKWTWDFGDGFRIVDATLDPDKRPVHSYSATATNNDFYKYNICVSVQNQHGCWDSICHPVELLPEFTFYIPNTFTPNDDKKNEFFFGKCRGVKEYDIWLFDRWGNQVWDCHKDDKNINWDSDATNPRQDGLSSACQWDGKVVHGGLDMGGNSRQFAQEDVYVWKVKLLDIFDKKHTYIGHVNIVK
jgi:hypothetical protein